MEHTPPSSVSGDSAGMSVRTFGGKFANVTAGTIVKFNVHDHPAVSAITRAFGKVEVLDLHAFAIPLTSVSGSQVQISLGWGHCEHAMPSSLAEMAQLPVFEVWSFAGGNSLASPGNRIVCKFDNSICSQIKPVALEGGRPSLYVLASGHSDEGKALAGALAQVFFRISVKVIGSDIIFN
uniref:Coat protein n=1 Tax=Prunus yellow spot-associated virus TaxID=2600310 RepID=A0A5B9C123_9VIRU|nr:coat protein [Prunus yellow spot-associated virus]QED94456.1 coat protein [Prunus yellow spot-associated virus]QED94457.1 coat protein [Prunus yellow spot-associated virus]